MSAYWTRSVATTAYCPPIAVYAMKTAAETRSAAVGGTPSAAVSTICEASVSRANQAISATTTSTPAAARAAGP